MNTKKLLHLAKAASLVILMVVLSGCLTGLFPQFTYQGRLTDENGNPLSGTYTVRFRVYNDDTGGDLLLTDTNNVQVEDGLFDAIVGPSSPGGIGNLAPEDLAQPLWVEVAVGDGTITETLSPRQRLYGAPYAFTLMPGSYISTTTFDTTFYGAGGVTGVLNVVNDYDGDSSNPALPALRVSGERGIEVTGRNGGGTGVISSNSDVSNSDLEIRSNDDVLIYLDDNDSTTNEYVYVYGTAGWLFRVEPDGDIDASGTKNAVVQVDDTHRTLSAIESTEVWFEDFGSATLVDGEVVVKIDDLFAKTVNLDEDYHIFLTPLGDSNGLFIAEKTATSFTVQESGGGTSDISFDYRIVAKRLGYEDRRMEIVSMDSDE